MAESLRATKELRETNYNAYIIELSKMRKEWASAQEVEYDVMAELESAMLHFPPMNSAHEGYAVIQEEVEELWDEVKAKQGARDVANMRKEAIQVAAMAIRFIVDVCDSQKGQK